MVDSSQNMHIQLGAGKLPIYLDYMATTPVDSRVAAKMQRYLTIDGVFGNPASEHFYGYQAREAIAEARQLAAQLINADEKEIIWTSGATEANNLALKGAAQFYQRKGKHIVTCKTEHKAVLATCKYLEIHHGFEVTYLTPERDGLLDLAKLEAALRDDTVLVSIMHVNNEIGVIQNIAEIGKLTRPRGILFHVDAAQSVGKIPIDVQDSQVDLLSFTAHKFYGPKGVGALYVRGKPRLHLEPQMHGGGQERDLRSGTLATHQIVGMGEACRLASDEMAKEQERILKLRQRFWDGIKDLGDVCVNGHVGQRVAGNLNVSFGGVMGEVLIAALKDLAVSSAAACGSVVLEPSYVLRAIGVSRELAQSAIRFCFGRFTTEEEIDYAAKHVREVVQGIRKHEL